MEAATAAVAAAMTRAVAAVAMVAAEGGGGDPSLNSNPPQPLPTITTTMVVTLQQGWRFGLGEPACPAGPPPRGLRRVAGDPPRCSARSTRAQGARRGAADVRRSGGTRGAEGEGEWFGGARTRTWGRAGGGGRPPAWGGRGAPSNPASDDFVDDRTPPGGRCRDSARPDLRHVCRYSVRTGVSPLFLLQVVGGWWVVRASRTCDPKPNGRNWRTRAANAARRVLGDMGQGGAGERAGWCCVVCAGGSPDKGGLRR